MIEEWRDIKNYEGVYQISSLGRIRSLDRYVDDKGHKRFVKGKTLKPSKHKDDYEYVVLYDRKHKMIHRLVAENFIDNPENKRTVNHINGDKSDNRVINLEWCTHKENINKAWEIGLYQISEKQRENGRKRGKNNCKKVIQMDKQYKILKVWDSITEASKTLNINLNTISNCAKRRKSYNTAGGYIWRYAEEGNNE